MAQDREASAAHYAKALLDILVELHGEKATNEAQKQLHSLEELSTGESGAFFSNPVFGKEEKLAVLEAAIKKAKSDDAISRFLKLLVSLGDIELLSLIAKAFDTAAREQRNEVVAHVRSAFPLETSDQERLKRELSRITGKEVFVEAKVDEELIGGVVAEVGGVVYDASIRNYLTRLQKEF